MATTPTTKITKAGQDLSLSDATDMVWHKTVIQIYPVTDSTLKELTAGYNSLHLVFLGIFSGAAITLLVAYKTVTDVTQKPYYLAALLAASGLAVLFGIFGIGNYLRASKAQAKLYKEAVPLVAKSPEISN
jgi:hypothetical protein